MRSLLITDRYLPHNGGSRYYYHELALRLSEAEVLTGTQPGDREFDATTDLPIHRRRGIRPNYASPWNRIQNPWLNLLLAYLPGMIAIVFWTLVELLRNRPRTVHAGGYAFSGLAARIWCPLLRIPYLVYAHGEDVSSTMRRRFFRYYMTWIFKGATRVVANCEHTATYLSFCGVEKDRVVIARPGVAPTFLKPISDTSQGRRPVSGLSSESESGPKLLSVGRLIPHKGHATVINAIPGLLRLWPTISYTCIGEGPEENRLTALANDLGISDRVHFRKGLSLDELKAAYSNADLFVQPNGEVSGSFEGYGMVYLEAGASGLAVIGGRSGGVPEAVIEGVTGLLVTPFDPLALIGAVNRLLSDTPLRRRMGRTGRKLARVRNWNATLNPALTIDSLLSAGRSEVAPR
jgi:phosphatidyl-myo-inositol dimannoside synthase